MQRCFIFDDNRGENFDRKNAYQKIATSFSKAYDYSIDRMPIHLNPFERGVEIREQKAGLESRNVLEFRSFFSEDYPKINIDQLCRKVQDYGLPVPNEFEKFEISYWQEWWAKLSRDIPYVQQIQLRRNLGLYCWSENPFDENIVYNVDIANIYIDTCYSGNDMRRIVDYLNFLSISNPGVKATTEQWHLWWEESAVLNDSLKNYLWWLICPYPYEIILVETE